MAKGEDWSTLAPLGTFTLKLYERPDWVRRRVETVQLVDTSQVERSVTLDVDLGALSRMAAESHLFGNPQPARRNNTDMLVPVTLLPKTLLLDLDIRDASGKSLSLATSGEDATAAQAALIAKLDRLGEAAAELPQVILDNLYRVARLDPSFGDEQVILRRTKDRRVHAWNLEDSAIGSTEYILWLRLLGHRDFNELLSTFTLNYMPMIRLQPGDGSAVIRYRHTERQQPPSKGWLDALSLDAYQQLIQAPSVGSGGREHLRFVPPEGLFVEEFYLTPPATGAANDPQPAAIVESVDPAPRMYMSRVTPERGIIYTTGMERLSGACEAIALLRPRVTGFLRTAQYTVLLTTLLLIVGAIAQFLGSRLSAAGTSAEAAATVLLIIPSTMSAFLAQAGEHELRSDLLRGPRVAVAASAAAAICAAGAMVLQITSWCLGLIWATAALIGAVAYLLLLTICARSNTAFVQTSRLAGRTFAFDLDRS
jgi:hypothetical protein